MRENFTCGKTNLNFHQCLSAHMSPWATARAHAWRRYCARFLKSGYYSKVSGCICSVKLAPLVLRKRVCFNDVFRVWNLGSIENFFKGEKFSKLAINCVYFVAEICIPVQYSLELFLIIYEMFHYLVGSCQRFVCPRWFSVLSILINYIKPWDWLPGIKILVLWFGLKLELVHSRVNKDGTFEVSFIGARVSGCRILRQSMALADIYIVTLTMLTTIFVPKVLKECCVAQLS